MRPFCSSSDYKLTIKKKFENKNSQKLVIMCNALEFLNFVDVLGEITSKISCYKDNLFWKKLLVDKHVRLFDTILPLRYLLFSLQSFKDSSY